MQWLSPRCALLYPFDPDVKVTGSHAAVAYAWVESRITELSQSVRIEW
jgi:hypothetical protein